MRRERGNCGKVEREEGEDLGRGGNDPSARLHTHTLLFTAAAAAAAPAADAIRKVCAARYLR